MPARSVTRKRGKPVRVRTKKLPDGTLLRVYVFDSRGKRGGRTVAEKVKPEGEQSGKAHRSRSKNA